MATETNNKNVAYNNQNSDNAKAPNNDQAFPQDQRANEVRNDVQRDKKNSMK